MELRDIEYFAVVAEHRNLRRASEVLGLSPPALSKSMRRLEESMQARLVERSTRGVELTPIGHALLGQVGRLRLLLRDIRREADDLSKGAAGHLRVGVGATTVEDLPAAYAKLLRDAPKLSIHVVVGDNDVMLPSLRRGELDLIFNIIPDVQYEDCAQEALFADTFVVCASAHHRLARRRRVTLADLVDERWALSAAAVLNVQHVRRAFEAKGLAAPQIAVEARSIRLRLEICARTRLLSFVARRMLEQAAPRTRLVELPVEELRWKRAVGVIYRNGAYLPPAARRLIVALGTLHKD